jgi:hypothetical protein
MRFVATTVFLKEGTRMRTSNLISGLAALALLGGAGVAWGQFNNGDFETGNTTGWTVRNTGNGVGAPGTVEQYDIDGPGPKGSTYAAKFAVGQLTFNSGVQEGVEVVQNLDLTGGVEYTISYSWGTRRDSGTGNAEGGVFAVIVDGQIVGTPYSSGGIGGSNGSAKYGDYSVTYTPAASGTYEVGARITRPYTSPGDVFEYVDDFDIDPPTSGCPSDFAARVGGTCPSSNSMAWSGAPANSSVRVLYTSNNGSGGTIPPNSPCPGTTLCIGLGGVTLHPQVLHSDGSGSGSVNSFSAPCGLHLQLITQNSCKTSNAMTL